MSNDDSQHTKGVNRVAITAEAKNEIGSAEASRRLGIRSDYLLMLTRSGKIAATKRDGVWRFSVEAINERLKVRTK
jgi:hypothetical protein